MSEPEIVAADAAPRDLTTRQHPTHSPGWLILFVLLVLCLALFRPHKKPATSQTEAETPLTHTTAASRREAEIIRSLEKIVSLDCTDEPLRQLLGDLATQLDVPLQLDRQALIDEGVATDQPMTLHVHDITGRSALQLILSPLQLDWVIQNEVLLVTTAVQAADTLTIHLYDISDFDPAENGIEELIELLTATVLPESWDEVGGPGSVREFHDARTHVLSIRQTRTVHEKITVLLADLRAHRRPANTAGRSFSPARGSARRAISRNRQPAQSTRLTPNAGPLSPSTEAVVRGNNQFALDLYAQLARNTTGNVFVSPFSISCALGMLLAGAGGETASEIMHVQHALLRQQDVPNSDHELRRFLIRDGDSAVAPQGVDLRAANRIWTQAGLEILPTFLETLTDEFDADAIPIDFRERPRAAAMINSWAEKETTGMIPQLVSANDLSDLTAFVLTNVVTFDGTWSHPFADALTTSARFRSGATDFEIPMMHNASDDCHYAEIDGLQLLEKPYGAGDWSMLILLPQTGPAALASLEADLSETNLLRWRAATRPGLTDVSLPRFQLQFEIELRDVLKSLGLQRAFDAQTADFSAICQTAQLQVDRFMHKAVVEVNERGTRAAAATSVGFFGGPPPLAVFRADHPFVFHIRENRSGTIVFIGRLVNPVE